MNVLIIIPNLGPGGAQAVFRHQLSMLSNELKVELCVFNTDGFLPMDWNLGAHSLEVPKGSNAISKIWNFCRRVIYLRQLKKKLKTDVTISHLEGADYVNIISGVTRTICWIHGSKKFDENISGAVGLLRHKVLMPLLYRYADAIVTVSKEIATEIREYIGRSPVRITTIYNSLELEQLQLAAQAAVPKDYEQLLLSNKVIALHCRLSKEKNIQALLTIFKSVVTRKPSKLVIVGDGDQRAQLLDLSRSLSLRTWSVWEGETLTSDFDVYFLGFHSNALRFVARASAFVMTSFWEGFPLALCEAVLLGVPVVAADCPTGPREILLTKLTIKDRVQVPTETAFGILMPIVRMKDSGIVEMWVTSIINVLERDMSPSEYSIRELLTNVDVNNSKMNVLRVIDSVSRGARIP